MTVWKFQLAVTDAQEILMPIGAESLHVAMQDNELCLWAKVDPYAQHSLFTFYVTGTGNPAPEEASYVGTVHAPPFVWHVWEDA